MSATGLRYLAATNAFLVVVYAATSWIAGASPIWMALVVVAMVAQILYLLVPCGKKSRRSIDTEFR